MAGSSDALSAIQKHQERHCPPASGGKKHKKTQSRTKKHTGRAFRGYGVYRASGAAHLQATTTIANA